MRNVLKKLGTATLALAVVSSAMAPTVAYAKPKKKGGKMVLIWPMLAVATVAGLVAIASGGDDRPTSP